MLTDAELKALIIPEHIVKRLQFNYSRTITSIDIGVNKVGICKWCLSDVKKPARYYCSPRCSTNAVVLMRCFNEWIVNRDNYTCQLCQKDLAAEQKEMDRIYSVVGAFERLKHSVSGYILFPASLSVRQENTARFAAAKEAFLAVVKERPDLFSDVQSKCSYNTRRDISEQRVTLEYPRLIRTHAYEIDHIIPIAKGGWTGPDNMRTLCYPCHRVETTKLQSELAKIKRLEGAKKEKPKRNWPSRKLQSRGFGK